MLIIQRPTVEAIDEEEANRQRFGVGPLEPGFGYTLGNSLRRTLLSSIPGAAVTQVRFDDSLHEFTTIPGVKEDVTDIILNLKDLVLRVDGDDPVTLRLDVRGPASVTAGDLQLTAEVEVLNPELPIATLNVAFSVEPTRVEQSTNYDRLILDIETDGSISPRDALSSAGATLRNLVSLVAEMSDTPQGLELGDVAAATSGSPDLDLPIEDLDLSERPRNCLKRAQVNTVGELVEKTADDLLAITNFGQKSLDEVLAKLDERGLALRVKEG